MASEKPESDGFLASIDAKIAALQQFRESYLAVLAAGALGQPSGDLTAFAAPPAGSTAATNGQQPASGPIELPTGVFRNKGLADAIRLYLSLAKRKQTQKEIKDALIEGGLATTSEFFDQTLGGTLHRLRKGGELLQFKEGWDLAASYPESFRQRLAQTKENSAPKDKKSNAPKRTRRRRRKPATARAGQPEKSEKSVKPEKVKKPEKERIHQEPARVA
jgi:hypothetical protein